MKKVAIVFPNYAIGGAETVVNSLAEALKPHGFDFTLITSTSSPVIKTSPFHKKLALDFLTSRYDYKITAQLADTLRPLSVDILWLAVDEFADIPTLRKSLNPGAKIIYHLHGVPFFQAHIKAAYNGNSGNQISYVKWLLFNHLREKLFRTYTKRYMKRTRKTAADVDVFITICESYARQLAEIYPEYADKFCAIHNPIINEQTSYTPADKKNEIIYLGRLTHADKRPDLLLKAFAQIAHSHPNWQLKIVGDGPERQILQQLALELKINTQTHFIGFTTNPARHLSSASILCLTSECESWGMALVEAMQHGVVPMAFNCSAGVNELLANGRGVLVKPGDINGYATKLSELMDNQTLRNNICATHPEFLSTLSIRHIIPQWQKLLL